MLKADITADVVRCLLAEQLPDLAALDVRPVELDGWDNTTFRVGDRLTARLPSGDGYTAQVAKEQRWLPVLAPHLPQPIPRPVAVGRPGACFPRPWSLYMWLPGSPALPGRVGDPQRFARDLAAFLAALGRAPTAGGPGPGPHSAGRGGPLTVWDDDVARSLAVLGGSVDADGVRRLWATATEAAWDGPDRWVHGDVSPSNLLVDDDGVLCGVIDFGCAAVGDPACDLAIAWTTLSAAARPTFAAGLDVDPGTWARARGWAAWKALITWALALRDGRDPASDARRFGWALDPAGVLEELLADGA